MALSSRGGQACAGAGTERIADAHAQRIASLDFPLLETASRKAPCYRLPARRQALELTLPRWFGISTRALFSPSNTISQGSRLKGPPCRLSPPPRERSAACTMAGRPQLTSIPPFNGWRMRWPPSRRGTGRCRNRRARRSQREQPLAPVQRRHDRGRFGNRMRMGHPENW